MKVGEKSRIYLGKIKTKFKNKVKRKHWPIDKEVEFTKEQYDYGSISYIDIDNSVILKLDWKDVIWNEVVVTEIIEQTYSIYLNND